MSYEAISPLPSFSRMAAPSKGGYLANPGINLVPFDRADYLDRFYHTDIGEEFRQWVLYWPVDALIGFLGIDLPRNIGDIPAPGGGFEREERPFGIPRRKQWLLYSCFNGLCYSHAKYDKLYVSVPKNHALRRMSKEERKAKGWGGFSKSSGGHMAIKVMELEFDDGVMAPDESTYMIAGGMGSFNGTVWKDLYGYYRWNDELDCPSSIEEKAGDGDSDKQGKHSDLKESKYPGIRPTGWIDWLDDEIGRLEVRLERQRKLAGCRRSLVGEDERSGRKTKPKPS